MKKITLTLLLFLFGIVVGFSQVTVGEGTNQEQNMPFEPYYGYTYSQSIYLSSEINASGTITSIQWYYSGAGDLESSQGLVIYMGQTDKESFDSETDFVPVDELTQVYSGGIITNSTPGWKTITLTTPFVYDNISNLVIAVDENMSDYDNSDDDFYNTSVSGQRSIYAFSDDANIAPADPTNNINEDFYVERGTAAFIPNVVLGGIQQACPNPTAILVSDVTTTNATAVWTAAVGQTNWEVIIQETELGTPMASETGVAVMTTPTYTKTDLIENTMYTVYVRAICSETLKSGWVASQSFNTLCLFSGDFEQNFDTTAYGEIPNCWSSINVSNNTFSYVQTVDYNSASPSNCVELYNSGDANAQLMLISPGLTSIGANTHRIKFKAKSYGNYTLILGTMTDPMNASTFTALTTYTLSDNYVDFNYTFNATTTDNFIAFKHGGVSSYVSIFIDDVVWEPIPLVAPECITDLNVTTNEECGNFPSLFEWAAVPGADGYYVSIGTSANGGDLVVDNLNVNSALSYSFAGNPGVTYYYTVTPYNAFGSATACLEDSFTTYEDGCYCGSVPTSLDNSGITLVQINDSEFQNEPVTYTDFTEEGAVDISRGVLTALNVTFATEYTYDTNVWIDFNDNYTFESTELVFTGTSTSASPTVLNASFLTSLTANLGEHRMRIGTADSGQVPPNPCYSGAYGVTLDFLVNVLEAPACLPPVSTTVTNITANTAQVNWISEGTLFNIEYDYDPFIQGGGTLVSGIATNSAPLLNLDAQTDYSYYIQTDCGVDGMSPWVGPFTFRTACDAFGDFDEDFSTEVAINAPECWSTLINSTSQNSYIQIYTFSNNVEMYNSDDANAALYLITPNLIDLPTGDHRVKFKGLSYSEGNSIIVGTMSDPNNELTFTAVQTVPLTDSFMEYAVSFSTVTTDTHVAFKFMGTGSYQSVLIDDFVWEPIPTVAPVCVSDLNVEINTECGNYPTMFSWSAVEGADYYNLTIGTTSGEGTTINIGNVTSYSFEGNFGTTYYYTLVPVNAFGSATGCLEGTFVTYSDGCYCESVPESEFIDGDGITNLEIGQDSFVIPLETYVDLTADGDVILLQGATSDIAITFETGYTYDTHIWVDWNDNYTFEASEKMFTGVAGNAVPFVLDASFITPASAAIGVHRMRIGTADSGQFIPNPCYNGTYGFTIDLNVDIQDPLSSGEFNKNPFSVYPNPVKDILNLSYTQNITTVEVYNLLGQKVKEIQVGSTQAKIDMTSLASGNYLVKILAEDLVKVAKIVKE